MSRWPQMSFAARFWMKVRVAPANACWEWLGALDSSGYGSFAVEHGKSGIAHRLAHELHVGPIPGDLTVDHLCRNTRCVNPLHMELVSMAVNIMRGRGVGVLNAHREECLNGHAYTDQNTRVTARGRVCRICDRARVAAYKARKRAAA